MPPTPQNILDLNYLLEEQKEVDRFFIKSHNSLKDAKDKFDLQYAEKVKNNPSLVKKKPTVSQYRLGVSATKKNEKIDSIRPQQELYGREYKTYLRKRNSINLRFDKLDFSKEEQDFINRNNLNFPKDLKDREMGGASMILSKPQFLDQFSRIDDNINQFQENLKESEKASVPLIAMETTADGSSVVMNNDKIEVGVVDPMGGVSGSNQVGNSGGSREGVELTGNVIEGQTQQSLSNQQVNLLQPEASNPLVLLANTADAVTREEADFSGSGSGLQSNGNAFISKANGGMVQLRDEADTSDLSIPETTQEDIDRRVNRLQTGGLKLTHHRPSESKINTIKKIKRYGSYTEYQKQHNAEARDARLKRLERDHPDYPLMVSEAFFKDGEPSTSEDNRFISRQNAIKYDDASEAPDTTNVSQTIDKATSQMPSIPMQNLYPTNDVNNESNVTYKPQNESETRIIDELVRREDVERNYSSRPDANLLNNKQLESNSKNLNLDQMKLAIQTFHSLYDVVIPQLKDKDHQLEKEKSMKSSKIEEVRKHFLKMELLVKSYFNSLGNNLSVGVIISAEDFMNNYNTSITARGEPNPISNRREPISYRDYTDEEIDAEIARETVDDAIKQEKDEDQDEMDDMRKQNLGAGRKDNVNRDDIPTDESVFKSKRRLMGEDPSHFSNDPKFNKTEKKHITALRGTNFYGDKMTQRNILTRNGGINHRYSKGIKGKTLNAIIPSTQAGFINNPTLRQDIRQPTYVIRPVIQRNPNEYVING